MRLASTLLLVSLVALPASGCAAAVVAAVGIVGYASYDQNESSADFDASLQQTWNAALGSLTRLGYPLPADVDLGPTEGTIVGKIDDDKYCVRVEQHPSDRSRVRVRIGTFYTKDHRRREVLILEEIERILAE